MSFRVRGTYLESCNCEAVCPCRMVGGVPGGRSTYGVCFGLLTWRIDDGHVEDVDLSGLAAALVFNYDDDEPESPWTLTLHVDARGNAEQRGALASLFLGGLGGPHTSTLPWIRKRRHLVAVVASTIDVTLGDVKVGETIRLRATRPVAVDEPVACAIPGYERLGRELYADELRLPEEVELSGNCAYASDFDYVSA
jgi:hypothetical protein